MPRYRPTGVTPLELWDLWVGSQTLWETMALPTFPEILVNMLIELRAGRGESRSDGPIPNIIRGFDAVCLGGGLATTSSLRQTLNSAPFPVHYLTDSDFPGTAGGSRILADAHLSGWVVDLGQKQLKISAGKARYIYPRDWVRLPLRTSENESLIVEQRSALRQFLAEALAATANRVGQLPEAVVFALPARIDDAGIPEGSSYIGMRDDSALITDTSSIAGWDLKQTWLLNDAELAAFSAKQDPALAAYKNVLVLTLGFAVGAALLQPWQ